MPVASPDEASAKPPRRESIEELFAALESPLLHYGLRLLRDHGAAEDVVQEAFMKLHVQFERIQEPRRWLYRTVHNLALNHQRRAGRIVPFDSSTGTDAPAEASTPDPLPLPDDQIARWEGIGLVRLGLETLDARSREIIRLKFNEDLSYKEIGVRTGLKPGHVGYLLHHALKAIAAELAKTGVLP